jgi:N6-adenosine-specific RNA methylase IME4
LADGKRHHGDGLYEKAAAILGVDESSLRVYHSISGRFQLLLRNNNLTWNHHKEVASIKKLAKDIEGKLAVSDEPDRDKMEELLAKAEKEKLSVRELRDLVRRHKEWQQEQIKLANQPEKYDVIYADPPWEYTSGDQHTDEAQETVLGTHYPSMPLKQICEIPVRELAADNAALFVWATSPTLEEAFQVIRAWGFEYKTSMVWDKVLHNVGNYVSVRHELLLICIRGAMPRVTKLVDSVHSEERSEHSRKPEHFRTVIEEMYPKARRIELFARTRAEGWEVWGNECPEYRYRGD